MNIKIIFIGIDYDEFKTNKYHSVYVRGSDNSIKHFDSGSPVIDYANAIEYCKSLTDYKEDAKIPSIYHEHFGNVLLSSTLDNFLVDSKVKYSLKDDYSELITINVKKGRKK